MSSPKLKPTVLIVDDVKSIRLVATKLLENNYEVVGCETAEEALLELQDELSPALVIVDIGLPGMSGLTFTRVLTKDPEFAHIPLIMLTGRDAPRDIMSGINAGARAYITKPIQPAEFIAKIDRVLHS